MMAVDSEDCGDSSMRDGSRSRRSRYLEEARVFI